MSPEYRSLPVDATSAARLADDGLRLATVDTADPLAFTAWLAAESRGFHEVHPGAAGMAGRVRVLGDRRTTGVWDDTIAEPAAPVATVSSWPAPLTLPGRTDVPAWAISAVTVSPTHRRRGIARALLESELRTAAALGIPVAMLTVSEATIYSRYGFAPSAPAADWTIDTRRARWTGPTADGRVHFVSLETMRDEGPALLERIRLEEPGHIGFDGHLWERLVGLGGDEPDAAKKLRAVRYDDGAGAAQGFAVYSLTADPGDFANHTLDVKYLASATDDAYAALWRFLLEMDLVATVRASLRSPDEAVHWQVSDIRGVTRRASDHLWTRILDVPLALEARRYPAPGRLVLQVTDPLGFAEGRFVLETAADGSARVTQPDGRADAAAGLPGLALSAGELAALYLGGTSAMTLLKAGRLAELAPGSAAAADSLFRSSIHPWLSIWF